MNDKPRLVLGNIEGPEGNAFVILGRAQAVAKAINELRPGFLDWPAIDAEAKSGDYDHLLDTMEKYFTVEASGGRYEYSD